MDPVMTRRTALGAALATTAAAAGPGWARPAVAPVPFFGVHQAGITTPRQRRLVLLAFDLTGEDRGAVRALLQAWSATSAVRTAGAPGAAARLTVTFAFGATLLQRLGLTALLPADAGPLPALRGDALDPARGGGDLLVQICADDVGVAAACAQELTRLAGHAGVATPRWRQDGSCGSTTGGRTPRNRLGFKDGTHNVSDRRGLDKHVWAGADAPAWLRGGTTLVMRHVHIDLHDWNATGVHEQERAVGRRKASGAPLGRRHEHDPLGLGRIDDQGRRVIPLGAHVRHAAAGENGGVRILRRGYNSDAGLVFLSYQRSPVRQTLRLLQQLATYDRLNPFLTPVASGVYLVPPGARRGGYVGETLIPSRSR